MALSEAQIMGFAKSVQGLFVTQGATLRKADLDDVALHANLTCLIEETNASNSEQEDLKKRLREKSIAHAKLRKKLYVVASGYLDIAIAAVEKDSPAAKIFRRLRSRVKRPDLSERVDLPGVIQPPVKPTPID